MHAPCDPLLFCLLFAIHDRLNGFTWREKKGGERAIAESRSPQSDRPHYKFVAKAVQLGPLKMGEPCLFPPLLHQAVHEIWLRPVLFPITVIIVHSFPTSIAAALSFLPFISLILLCQTSIVWYRTHDHLLLLSLCFSLGLQCYYVL